MEPLFENSYTPDKSFYKEIYGYFHFRRPITVAAFIICAVCFLAQLVLAIFDLEHNPGIMILMAVFPLFKLFAYLSQIGTLEKCNKEVSSEQISISTLVHEGALETTSSTGAVINIELSKIRGAVQTKRYIVLRSDARLIYSFSKDGFTKGTKEDFLAFLRSKNIKVSGK